MDNAWYDPDTLAWLPGVIMGIAGAVLGVLTGKHAQTASHPTLIVGGWLLFKTAAVLLTIAGIVAAWSEQPHGIWYGLMLPGLIGITVAYLIMPVVKRRYAAAMQETVQKEAAAGEIPSQDGSHDESLPPENT